MPHKLTLQCHILWAGINCVLKKELSNIVCVFLCHWVTAACSRRPGKERTYPDNIIRALFFSTKISPAHNILHWIVSSWDISDYRSTLQNVKMQPHRSLLNVIIRKLPFLLDCKLSRAGPSYLMYLICIVICSVSLVFVKRCTNCWRYINPV